MIDKSVLKPVYYIITRSDGEAFLGRKTDRYPTDGALIHDGCALAR